MAVGADRNGGEGNEWIYSLLNYFVSVVCSSLIARGMGKPVFGQPSKRFMLTGSVL